MLERVTLLEDSPVITAAMLALDGRAGGGESGTTLVTPRSAEALRAEERQQLVEALDRSRGNITRAAAHLGIHRNTLRYRLAKHELTPRAPASDGEGVQPVTPGVVTTSPAAPAAKVIRWEERLVAVLGVSIVAAVGATFDLAAMIADLIQLATSFGARIEQFSPSELVAVFGIDPMEDAARRAVLVAQAMLQAVILWQVYAISHSTLSLAIVGLLGFASALLSSLIGGVVVDAYDRRVVLFGSQLVPGLGSLGRTKSSSIRPPRGFSSATSLSRPRTTAGADWRGSPDGSAGASRWADGR